MPVRCIACGREACDVMDNKLNKCNTCKLFFCIECSQIHSLVVNAHVSAPQEINSSIDK